MFKYKRKNDEGIYGLTAKWYDKNSRKSRLTEMQEYANEVSKYVKDEGTILEIAPGPGYLSIELAKKGYKVTGVELSPDFVKIEKANAKEANVFVDLRKEMFLIFHLLIINLILQFVQQHLKTSKIL